MFTYSLDCFATLAMSRTLRVLTKFRFAKLADCFATLAMTGILRKKLSVIARSPKDDVAIHLTSVHSFTRLLRYARNDRNSQKKSVCHCEESKGRRGNL